MKKLDRRGFLSGVALASSAAAAGCGAARPHAGVGADDPRAVLERLEHGLARIRSMPPGWLERRLPYALPPGVGERDVQDLLRALLVADAARAVRARDTVPARLALRLGEESAALERCVDTFHALHARMPEAARRRLNELARRNDELSSDVAQWIDERAAEVGVTTESRARVRRAAAELKIRFRRQSATAVLDEVSSKASRIRARRSTPVGRATRARSTALLATIRQRLETGAGRRLDTPRPTAPVIVTAGPPGPARPRWNEHYDSPGDHDVRLGAILMPFGLITCGVLLYVGLGLVISGVVRNETWDGRPERESR